MLKRKKIHKTLKKNSKYAQSVSTLLSVMVIQATHKVDGFQSVKGNNGRKCCHRNGKPRNKERNRFQIQKVLSANALPIRPPGFSCQPQTFLKMLSTFSQFTTGGHLPPLQQL